MHENGSGFKNDQKYGILKLNYFFGNAAIPLRNCFL